MGFDGTVALMAVPRGAGDYLVASTGAGYAVLGLALVVLLVADRDAAATRSRPPVGDLPTEKRVRSDSVPTVNM